MRATKEWCKRMQDVVERSKCILTKTEREFLICFLAAAYRQLPTEAAVQADQAPKRPQAGGTDPSA